MLHRKEEIVSMKTTEVVLNNIRMVQLLKYRNFTDKTLLDLWLVSNIRVQQL